MQVLHILCMHVCIHVCVRESMCACVRSTWRASWSTSKACWRFPNWSRDFPYRIPSHPIASHRITHSHKSVPKHIYYIFSSSKVIAEGPFGNVCLRKHTHTHTQTHIHTAESNSWPSLHWKIDPLTTGNISRISSTVKGCAELKSICRALI
jgi:hypothetical protein